MCLCLCVSKRRGEKGDNAQLTIRVDEVEVLRVRASVPVCAWCDEGSQRGQMGHAGTGCTVDGRVVGDSPAGVMSLSGGRRERNVCTRISFF